MMSSQIPTLARGGGGGSGFQLISALSTDCKFSDGLFVDCKCPETEVARNRNDYQVKRLVGSEEDTILTTDAIFISSQNGFEDQTKKTTTTSVIINWVTKEEDQIRGCQRAN